MDLSFLGPSAAAVVMAGMFLKYIQNKDKSQESRDQVFAAALKSLTKSNERVAKATEIAAKEAKERNGHLAELAIENHQINLKQTQHVLNAVKNLSSQHVDKQVVKHQEVKLSD